MDLDDEELEATRKLHNRKEEIEIGEYGRTNTGKIFIFAWLQYENGKIDKRKVLVGDGKSFENNFYYFKENEKIVKHSSNIIDLIEEDDIGIMRYNGLIFKKFITKDDILELKFKNYELLEIVTKEQFNQVKYEV